MTGLAGPGLIVAINDQRTQLRLIAQILKQAEYQVAAFECPLQFLESLPRLGPIALIITDLNMPQLNGWDLCSKLRSPELAACNPIPILVVSATFAGLQATDVRMDLGVNDFLPVPFSPETLRNKVSDILLGNCPKARLRCLLVGYREEGPEVECFRSFGYQVVAAANLDDCLPALGTNNFEVLVYRGPLTPDESQLLFSPNPRLLCTIWVAHEHGQLEPQLKVHCLAADATGDHLVHVCENARQQGCLVKVRELLERRTQQLLSSEQKYRTLFQCIPDVVLCLSEGGTILDVNEAGGSMLGSSSEQLVGRNLVDLVPGEGQIQVQVAIQETLLYGYVHYEAAFRCRAGELAAEVHQRKVDLEGRACILAIARDVSERRQCQQAVLASDTRYRIVAENTYDWEFWLSPQGFFLFSSPSAETVSGYPSVDFEDDPFLLAGLVVEEDRHHFDRNWRMESPADLPKDFEFRFHHPDGSIRWLHHVSVAVFDSQGNFLGSRGNHRDVTQRKRLDQERTKLVAALEQVSDAILVTDPCGVIQYANQAFINLYGSRGDGWVGVSAQGLPGDESWHSARLEILANLKRGEGWSGCYTRFGAAPQRHIATTVGPVKDENSHISSFVWVERDVTEERRLAEQLRQSQKLEAIGTLAGGIAHDFNNMLSGILGYSSLLKLQAGPQAEIAHSAEVIERTARRAAELTQKLLGFARRGKNQHVEVCMHRAINDCIELLSRTIDKRIEIIRDFGAPKPTVMGDPTQIEQVLLNLAINARDALGDKGQITFTTRAEVVDSTSRPEGDQTLGPGKYLVVSVKDNGTGIGNEIRERIFEPFFTTKEDGKGTGMGLPMVYGIVKNHGGGIDLRSQTGLGTVFDVYLPLAVGPVPVKEASSRTPVRGSGLIMVVDDEELLRDVATRFLTHLGYQVVTAADGLDAERVYAGRWQDIDLVLIDMMMPRMGGAECFRALKLINPGVRAILSTGYCLNEAAQEMLDDGLIDFIQKPYQLQQLSEIMARSLQTARSA